jgi:hypothetical protein
MQGNGKNVVPYLPLNQLKGGAPASRIKRRAGQ